MTGPDPAGVAGAAWGQWHARCALARCEPGPAGVLRSFAGARAASLVRRLGHLAEGAVAPDPRDAWHLFETHLVTTRTREGKRYKDWLFARAAGREGQDRIDTIQGGATLILRDVVREWIHREARPFGTASLDAPVPGTEGLRLSDLVPAGSTTADDVESRDLDAHARRTAGREFAAASRRVRIGLCLRALGLPLDGPAVERAAGCAKSSLHAAVRSFTIGLAEGVLRDHPAEAPGTAHAIAARAVVILRELARDWGRLEKALDRFFHKVEGAPSRDPAHPRETPI